MKTFALVLAATLGLAVPASAAVVGVFSDTFNYGPDTILNADDSVFGGNWNVTNGTVDYLASGSGFSELCPTGHNCVDLDGSTGASGLFSTAMTFGAGVYNVLFQISGSGRMSNEEVTVSFGGVSYTIALGSSDTGSQAGIAAFSNIHVGAGGTKLSFQNAGGDNVGIILKSVNIDQVAAVPLPAAGGLMLAGLAGLAGLRRRKARV